MKLHVPEPAALKLGQIADFLNNCLTVLSSYSPRNVTKEKFFDLCAMVIFYGQITQIFNYSRWHTILLIIFRTLPQTHLDVWIASELTWALFKQPS